MLEPRFPVARPLTLCLWLGSIAAVGFWGCQGPDTFLRKPGSGAGGGSNGVGGSSFGTGGHGTGGTSFGTGGSRGSGGSGVGGRTGTGGSLGTGGSFGVGGARDGGVDARGTGGAIFVDAGSDSEVGVIGGNGPCAGLCANPVILTMTSNAAASLGTGATCHEVPGTVGHIVCGNFSTKVLSVDGTPVVCPDTTSATITVPATTLNGGHCIQSTAGDHPYAYFSTY